jgi:protein ImuB
VESIFIVPRGETEAAVLPLPVKVLRIDPAIAAGLATMGLPCVADIAARPRAPLAARFGEALIRRLDQALGRADEPISPRLPLPQAMAERRFPEPIALEADVLGTIEQLARQLAEVLERRGEGTRLLGVVLFRTDGAVHRLEIGTGSPLREPARVRRLFEDRLAALGDACDPGFGYDIIRLSALVTERCDPVQAGLRRVADTGSAEELAHLIDRLGARFGLRRVTRLVPQDTHIPEFAAAAVPAHVALSSPPPLKGRSTARSAVGRGVAATSVLEIYPPPQPSPSERAFTPVFDGLWGEGEESPAPESLSPIRPIRLFERPEPVEAMAAVPDGPPVRFRWRQVLHEVASVEGPERIAMQWWRDETGRALTRDYFRVESRLGARVWLYREGLYGRETERPRWYLHGLFA